MRPGAQVAPCLWRMRVRKGSKTEVGKGALCSEGRRSWAGVDSEVLVVRSEMVPRSDGPSLGESFGQQTQI